MIKKLFLYCLLLLLPGLSQAQQQPMQVLARLSHARCGTQNTGSIRLDIQGGTAPFYCEWTGPNHFVTTATHLRNVDRGLYRLVITDNSRQVQTLVLDYYMANAVEWKTLRGMRINPDQTLSKSSAAGWNAGAASLPGLGVEGYIEWIIPQVQQQRYAIGLSFADPDESYRSIGYALMLDQGLLKIYESGVLKSTIGQVGPRDVLRINRLDNHILYYLNNREVGSALIPAQQSQQQLLVDASLHSGTLPVIGATFCSLSYTGGDTERNYVRRELPQVPVRSEQELQALLSLAGEISISTRFYDGLGRPGQSIAHHFSPEHKDLVQPVEYDAMGRQEIQYLPYSIANNSCDSYRSEALREQKAFYSGQVPGVAADEFPFARTVFEASPLNRVVQQGAPGADWQPKPDVSSAHTLKTKHFANSDEALWCWQMDSQGNFFIAKNYAPGSLFGTQNTDEHQHRVLEYSNSKGQLIVRKLSTTKDSPQGEPGYYAKTYYLYDPLGNLRAVIQPEGVKRLEESGQQRLEGEVLERYTFRYDYDERRRLIRKTVPGSGPVEMVYDRADRLAASQDANQRHRGEWTVFKYDRQGRLIMSGLYSDDSLRETLQMRINQNSRSYEQWLSDEQRYSQELFPVIAPEQMLIVQYYDRYLPQMRARFAPALDNQSFRASVSPRPVMTQTRIWRAMDWQFTHYYYDDYGRLIQTLNEDSALQVQERVSQQYDFTGRVLRSQTEHRAGIYRAHFLIDSRHDYDHAGRLLRTYHRVSDLAGRRYYPEILLAQYRYNELGQLQQKQLHSQNLGTSFLQHVDLSYHIRGWLEGINDIGRLGSPDGAPRDLFAMQLGYNRHSEEAQYNGNIGAMHWMSGRDSVLRSYHYRYDAMDRLLSARYLAADIATKGDYSSHGLGYDLNGNLIAMQRMGIRGYQGERPVFGLMDDLQYHYEGNRLVAVNDRAPQLTAPSYTAADFRDNGSQRQQDEYYYDPNGNLTYDANKGIQAVRYNPLNLPQSISWGVDGRLEYIWNAAGVKLGKVVRNDGQEQITDYIGLFVYDRNDTLRRLLQIATPEGRLVYDNEQQQLQYQYYYRDHLGSIRTCFAPMREQGSRYTLSMERDSAAREEAQFEPLADARVSDNNAYRGQSYARLNRELPPIRLQRSQALPVQRGDRVLASVYTRDPVGKRGGSPGRSAPPPEKKKPSLVPAPLISISAVPALPLPGDPGAGQPPEAPATATEKRLPKSIGLNLLALVPLVKQLVKPEGDPRRIPEDPPPGEEWLPDSLPAPEPNPLPAGYLKVSFYEDSTLNRLLDEQYIAVAAGNFWTENRLEAIAEQAGYAIVSIGSEHPDYIGFDQLEIEHLKDERALIVQENAYEAFGMTLGGLDYVHPKLEQQGKANRFLYNGKEQEQEKQLAWYDFGARMYDVQLGRWHVADPLAEKYASLSPYAYCANDPINYVDPKGRSIDPANQKEWDKEKASVISMRDHLKSRIDNLTAKAAEKGWSAEKLNRKIGDLNERVSSLNGSIQNLNRLEASTQVYALNKQEVVQVEGGIRYDPKTGKIVINYGTTANFVHETTHAGQFETGDIAFDSKSGDPLAQDVFDEIAAYKAQFAYDPSSISETSSTTIATSFEDITVSWVQGIKGGNIYVPMGHPNYVKGTSSNTGVAPLNINSGREDFIRAYPNYPDMRTMPANYVLKNSRSNTYYKK